MKLLHVVMLLTVVVIPRVSTGATLEECSPAFAADMPIVWAAPTNHIPERLWTYKVVPRIFSASAISNGIMMAGLQHKGVPRPSTNSVVIRADHSKWNPRPPYFAIHPDYGAMTFFPGLPAPDSRNFARDPDAVKRALQCAALLGVDPMDLSPTNCDSGLSGVFLTRRMDGFSFARDSEGFSIQFGKDGKILGFGLQWLKLERDENCETATLRQMTQCIQQRRAVLFPNDVESDYFTWVKDLGTARKLTITRITPYWTEGRFGEDPPEQSRPKHVTPAAELEALAVLGTNTVRLRLCTAMLAQDVRLLLPDVSPGTSGLNK